MSGLENIMPPIPFDPSDPIVALLAVALTEMLKRVLPAAAVDRLKPVLPAIVVLLAVFLRVLADGLAAEPVTVHTFLRGLASAGVAVLAHDQFQATVKGLKKDPPEPPVQPTT